jgi:cell division transport system permease protein
MLRNRFNLKDKKSGIIAVFFSITSVLVLFGCLLLLMITANKLVKHLEENVVITAYFSRSSPESGIKSTHDLLKSQDGFRKVELVSSTEAASYFNNELGDDYLKKLGENPLPSFLKLYVDQKVSTSTEFSDLIRQTEEAPYIFEVDFQESMAYKIKENKKTLTLVLVILVLIFLAVSLILINNTIRLQIYSDRFKVKSMQLVGATEAFIRKPYLVRSFGVSVLGAVLASTIVFMVYRIMSNQLSGFDSTNIPIHFSDIRIYSLLFVTLLICGVTISFCSAYLASRKYLRSKIDELY